MTSKTLKRIRTRLSDLCIQGMAHLNGKMGQTYQVIIVADDGAHLEHETSNKDESRREYNRCLHITDGAADVYSKVITNYAGKLVRQTIR